MAGSKKRSGKDRQATDGSTPTDVVGEAHDSLVKSLESIKELLLQSESKISAAKENIARADMSRQGIKEKGDAAATGESPSLFDPGGETSATSEPEPATDEIEEDIDAFLAEVHDDEPPSIEEDVPMLEDVVVPGKLAASENAQETQSPPALSADTIEAIMNEFQNKLEKKVHDTLIQAIVQLESELKAQIREEVEELRRQLIKGED